MRPSRALLVAGLLLILVSIVPLAAQDYGPVVGKWNIEFEFQGNPIRAQLEIERSDEGIRGTWTGPRGQSDEILLAAWDGEHLAFARKLERNGQQFEIHYTATIESHEMKGTIKFPQREIPFTGTK